MCAVIIQGRLAHRVNTSTSGAISWFASIRGRDWWLSSLAWPWPGACFAHGLDPGAQQTVGHALCQRRDSDRVRSIGTVADGNRCPRSSGDPGLARRPTSKPASRHSTPDQGTGQPSQPQPGRGINRVERADHACGRLRRPFRRTQAGHAPPFLVDHDPRAVRQHFAQVANQPGQRQRAFDVTGEQDDAGWRKGFAVSAASSGTDRAGPVDAHDGGGRLDRRCPVGEMPFHRWSITRRMTCLPDYIPNYALVLAVSDSPDSASWRSDH